MWKYIKEELPSFNKKVLVFRDDKERYTIGKLISVKGESGYKAMHWRTEYGSYHLVVPEDQWLEFEYATKLKICE